MNGSPELSSAEGQPLTGMGQSVPSVPECHSFFQRVDWLAFGITVAVALGGFLFTLAPEVTLESSGVYATGARYAGVNCPPGLPLWTLYAWLFTKLLPFHNIAWRIGVSSAV